MRPHTAIKHWADIVRGVLRQTLHKKRVWKWITKPTQCVTVPICVWVPDGADSIVKCEALCCVFMIWHGDMSRWMTSCLGHSLASHYIGTLSHIGTWQWMQHEYFDYCLSFILYVGSDLFAFISNSYKHIQIQYVISNKRSWFTGHEMLIICIAHVTDLLFLLHLRSIEMCIFFPQHHFYTDVTRDGPDRRKDSTEEQTHDAPHLLYDSERHIIATNWQERTGVKG